MKIVKIKLQSFNRVAAQNMVVQNFTDTVFFFCSEHISWNHVFSWSVSRVHGAFSFGVIFNIVRAEE